MTTLTTRDRWLAAMLPAMLTLLIGWFFFLRPAQKEVNSLRQRVENQGPASARQPLVTRAQAEAAAVAKSIADLREAQPAGAVFDRNWAMQQASLLCAAHGLSLNSSSLEAGGRLPPALQESTAALLRAPGSTPPQVWRLELTGSYPGIVNLLGGLAKTEPLIIPLNLSMEADKNERRPSRWVLTLWL